MPAKKSPAFSKPAAATPPPARRQLGGQVSVSGNKKPASSQPPRDEPAKKVKFANVKLAAHCEAFEPSTFPLQTTSKAFSGGNLWVDKGTEVVLKVPITIAAPTSDEERYGSYRISCKTDGSDATGVVLQMVDDFVEALVRAQGDVPSSCKHFALLRGTGWANFKIPATQIAEKATPDGRDWSQLEAGASGTLELIFRGVWRSEELGGYGAMVKARLFEPFLDQEAEAPVDDEPDAEAEAEDGEEGEEEPDERA